MLKNFSLLCCLAFFAVLFSCKNNDAGLRNIEEFYFPLGQLGVGRVYEYEPLDAADPPVFWHYKTTNTTGTTHLLGTSYGPQFQVDQFAREERVGNGMLLTDFFIYEMDSTGNPQQIRADIEAANVFPFQVKPLGSALLTSLHWRPLGDSSSITLVRNRQYDSDTTIVFEDKKIPAVKFNTRELIDQEEVGHLELEFGGMEVYAKGIGLVYFRKDVSGQRRIEYRLKAIYSLEEFEAAYGVKLEGIGD